MANLPETPQWEEGIYQIEVSDPVLGGPDGISNRQGKQLASRTLYLKQQVEKGGSDLAKHIAAADPHTQYAPKASPTFTGTPTAPTPANSDNSKKLATTEFVAKALAALAGSAPETLDTLKELADALGNDPNFATTVLNKLAEKLAKDKNGADIPDPALFVKNLRLVDENGYAGRMVKISAFTTSGVFTKSEGAKFALVRAVGGGGGGGGTAGVSNQQAVGAAGESGGYIEAWIDLASVTSLPVTIGSAGAGGAAGANFGSSGGTTTLGTLVTCPGGNGGPGGSSSSGVPSLNSDYGSESTVAPSTTGKLIASIRSKRDSYRMALSLAAVIGGCGGSSPFGRGGAPGSADSGKDGQGYGSGGGGASSTGTSFKGGNGTPGIMIIQEYF
ncbi:TPA: hypothetical protein ACYZZ9_000458 [Escherichia coli]